MKKEDKAGVVNSLVEHLGSFAHYYLADISGLNAGATAKLRAICYTRDVKLVVVKNTFFAKALENAGKTNAEISATLEGPSAVMFCNTGNVPAKLIKEFRKTSNGEKPLLKAAFVDECTYIGENQLTTLVNIKSREELLGDIVALLQSPAKNVISALQGSAGQKIAGLVKTLESRAQ